MRRRQLALFSAGKIIAGVAVSCCAGVFAAGWFLGRPAPETIGAPPADLAATEISLPGSSGRAIRGWLAQGQPGRGALLLLHPIRGNRTTMLGRARFLRDSGYTILLIDLQAHGESAGDHITFGALESRDAATALAFLRSRAPGERVAVIGWSLGGAAALLGAGPLVVDALVLEAVYPTIEEAAADRLRIRLRNIGPVLAPLLTSQLRLWTGIHSRELRPVEAITRLRAPLLLIAGERDPRTPLSESRRLFAAAPLPKELWVVAGAGHDDFHAIQRAEYERRVSAFLHRFLPRER